MRVYRIETMPYGVNEGTLRQNRVGIFSGMGREPRLMRGAPGPWKEFPEYQYESSHYFALPRDMFLRVVHQLNTEYTYVGIYEVEPLYVGETQVIFHDHTARFVKEYVPVVLEACVLLKKLIDCYKSFTPRNTNGHTSERQKLHTRRTTSRSRANGGLRSQCVLRGRNRKDDCPWLAEYG